MHNKAQVALTILAILLVLAIAFLTGFGLHAIVDAL